MAKRKSRATRNAEYCGEMEQIAEQLESIAEDVRGILFFDTKEERMAVLEKAQKDADDQFGQVSSGEWSDLLEELSSWKDGMDGTNLEYTDKYQTLESSVSELEDAISTIDNVSEPEFDGDVCDENAIEEYASELEATATEIRDAVSSAENAEFPGMFG
jgi:hypothetical protein